MSVTMSGTGATPEVTWEQPGDEQMFWQQDRMHFPNQLSADGGRLHPGLLSPRVLRGGRRLRDADTPASAALPHPPLSGDRAAAALARRARGDSGKRFGAEHRRRAWPGSCSAGMQEFLPEMRGLLADWESFDLAGASDADTAGALGRDDAAPGSPLAYPLPDRAPDAPEPGAVRRDLHRSVRGREFAGEYAPAPGNPDVDDDAPARSCGGLSRLALATRRCARSRRTGGRRCRAGAGARSRLRGVPRRTARLPEPYGHRSETWGLLLSILDRGPFAGDQVDQGLPLPAGTRSHR